MMLLVTETRNELYIVEYNVAFWLNDILVITIRKTEQDTIINLHRSM